jgi:TusA-related sulfurtransferase
MATMRRPIRRSTMIQHQTAAKHRVIDLRGLPNPEPVLRMAAEAAWLKRGEFLDVLTDDPCAPGDFLRWSQGSGDVHLLDVHYIAGGNACAVFRRGAWGTVRRRARMAA